MTGLYVSSKKQDCTTWLLHNDKLKLKHKYMYSCPSLGDKELLGIEEIKNLIKHSFENVLTCTRSLCASPPLVSHQVNVLTSEIFIKIKFLVL